MDKIYVIKKDNSVMVHDPTPRMIPFFRTIDPNYQVESIQPGPDFQPKYQALRNKKIKVPGALFDHDPDYLQRLVNSDNNKATKGDEYTALDVSYVVAMMRLKSCSLCGWKCGVNRFLDEKGHCGQGSKTTFQIPFQHIGEETVINPAIVSGIKSGCSMKCVYCIDHESLWDSSKFEPLEPDVYWAMVHEITADFRGHNNTIEFTNPTEAPHSIIRILLGGANDSHWPVVANSHLYGSIEFYQIFVPIVDVWLVSFPYGNNECAKSLSKVDGYIEQALSGIDYLVKNKCRIIVRILVLPGHISCCHEQTIKFLAQYRDHIWVSILDQYIPEGEATADPVLSRRPTRKEIEMVETLVKDAQYAEIGL